MKIHKIGILIIILSLTAFTAHKYYVSLTQIHHNEKEKSVEITLQVFTDDLELCLNNQFHQNFSIGNNKELAQTNQYILSYLKQKLSIKINGKAYEYQLLGKEIEDDLTFIYLEIKGIKSLKSIAISNQLFFESFAEQQHIIKIKAKGSHKNILLFKDKYQELIAL